MSDKKLFLSVDALKPGMITAEVIFNRFGNVLLWDNTELNESMIQHLRNMGVYTVAVYEKREQDFKTYINIPKTMTELKFKIDYQQNVEKTKDIFRKISAGRHVEVNEICPIIQSEVYHTESNRFVIDAVMQVRNADEYTYYHSLNVSLLAMVMGKWLKLSKQDVQDLTVAGILHDIGKTQVPDEILNKLGKLTDEEFEIMKRHSEYGYNIVVGIKGINERICTAILTHHEKEDGSGYPLGLTGDKIGLFAKILTVADIFDAMTASRAYRDKDTPFKVFELMQHGSFGKLDPIVLNAFLKNITNYYIGSKVRLNTGEIGEVVFMNSRDFSKPVVMVNNRYVDTMTSKTEEIAEFL